MATTMNNPPKHPHNEEINILKREIKTKNITITTIIVNPNSLFSKKSRKSIIYLI